MEDQSSGPDSVLNDAGRDDASVASAGVEVVLGSANLQTMVIDRSATICIRHHATRCRRQGFPSSRDSLRRTYEQLE